jgi:hypothetical protein
MLFRKGPSRVEVHYANNTEPAFSLWTFARGVREVAPLTNRLWHLHRSEWRLSADFIPILIRS